VTTPSLSTPDLTSFIEQAKGLYATDPKQEADKNSVDALMKSMLEQSGSRAEDRATAMQSADFQAKQEANNATVKKLQMLSAERDTLESRLAREAGSRGDIVTRGGIASTVSDQERDLAVRTRFAVAEHLATSNDLQGAIDQVNTAVDDKYADRATTLANQKMQLDYLQQKIQSGEVKADKTLNLAINERNRILQEQQRQLDDKKEEEKGIQNIKMTIASYGGDVSRLNNAKTIDEAIEMAGTSLQDPRLNIDIETAKTNLAKMKQDMYYSKLKSEAELHPSSVITEGITGDISSLLATNKIGQTTKTQIGTILGVLNAAEEMATASEGGNFPGISPANVFVDFIPFRNALRQQKGTENIGYINGINLKIQQWASGAALTEQQTKQVENMTPNKNDTDKNVAIKLNNLSNFMQLQIKGTLQSEGIQYTPEKIDLFNKKQTLEDIFK
ncbi:MAG: hypothetical protein WC724_03845, partial [Candidatus Paceibacterota bacterium]